MPTILLHGLGQTPESWNAVARALGRDVLCPPLFAPLRGVEVTYGNLYSAFAGYCDRLEGPLHLCGLSLGGIAALQYAIERPGRTASLVLIGTQYVMPKGLLKFQNLVFRLMPGRTFRQMGLAKRDVIGLTRSMMDLDFRESLGRAACPVLVLCGERDHANRKAAAELQEALPNAELVWVPGAGHEINTEAPEALAGILESFWHRTDGIKAGPGILGKRD